MLKRLLSSVFLCFALIFGTVSAASGVSYTITYNCSPGTGTAPSTQTVSNGASVMPRESTCTPPMGKHFMGWKISNTNTVVYPGRAFTYNYTANKTLTAVYANGMFSVQTTTMPADSYFDFTMNFNGKIIVNCGIDSGSTYGTLTGSGSPGTIVAGSNGNYTVTRSDTSEGQYRCHYNSSGVKNIMFSRSGSISGYQSGNNMSPLAFANNIYIDMVFGNLATLFPSIGSNAGQYPQFIQMFVVSTLSYIPSGLFANISTTSSQMYVFSNTFFGCTNLTSIPQALFEDVVNIGAYSFMLTFGACTGLTNLPQGLFANVSGGADGLFESTFEGCSNLLAVPKGFFSGITVGAVGEFVTTFKDCTSLNTIGDGIFRNVTSSASSNNLFSGTFRGCTDLTDIPQDLFQSITTAAQGMFSSTFESSGVKGIPSGLFATVVTPNANATSLFNRTFYGCQALDKVPASLFSSITIGATSMFSETFSGCVKLNGIYADWFSGITTGADYMFNQTFYGCTKLVEIPNGLFGQQSINTNTAQYMFFETFRGCTLIGSEGIVRNGIFIGITKGAAHMFDGTFYGCTGIKRIEDGLFGTINNTLHTHTHMFYRTFYGCENLVEVPNDTFIRITVGAPYMFAQTFYGCTSVAYIGEDGYGLFRSISDTEITDSNMFSSTFEGCSSLEYVPYDTFGAITVGAPSMFYATFRGCTLLRDIGPDLFRAVDTTVTQTGSATSMFSCTFEGCSSLRAIPEGLFRNITKAPGSMFTATFRGCSSITYVPYELFAGIQNISGGTVFYQTFKGCSGIRAIGRGLFSGINTISNNSASLFQEVFDGCSSLEEIPDNLFENINVSASQMFLAAFRGCTSLQVIPKNLFENIKNGAVSMFNQTFYGCTGLSSLPNGLFASVRTVATSMFTATFSGCSNLSGYVPTDFFDSLTNNNSPTATNLMQNMFSATGLLTTCPAHMQDYAPMNTYKNLPWNTGTVKVSCEYLSYQVTYVNGGHSGSLPSPNPTTAQYNTNFVPATNNLTPDTGYSADGWRIQGTNVVIPRGSSITWTYDTPQILEPTFKPNVSGAITLNSDRYANSSASTPVVNATVNAARSPVYSKYGVGVYASRNNANSGINRITSLTTLPQLTGCTFAGFYTGKAGSGTQVINSSGQYLSAAYTQVPNNNTTATWYANWTQCNVALNWFNEDGTTPFTPSNSAANQCVYDATVTIPNPDPNKSGYHFVGWCLDTGLSSYWSDVQNEILAYDSQHMRWEPSAPFPDGHTMNEEFSDGSTSGGLNPGEWGVTFSTGELLGRTLCSTTSGTYTQTGNPDENIAGDNCWCAGTKYGNSCQISPLSWVYYGNYGVGLCETHCAYWCATETRSYSNGFRAAVFGATQ